jgi:hypothetical protein
VCTAVDRSHSSTALAVERQSTEHLLSECKQQLDKSLQKVERTGV